VEDHNPLKKQIKVYVAGASAEAERVRLVMNMVQQHPYLKLAHDWLSIMQEVGKTKADHQLSLPERQEYAMADLEAVNEADVFWYLAPHTPSAGAAFEFGAAWGIASQWSMSGVYVGHTRVIVASGVRADASIFVSLADEVWEADMQAYESLSDRAKQLIEV